MIFITLGTQDKSFHRLLEEMELICERQMISERIVVQAGFTEFSSKFMEVVDYIPYDQFEKLIQEADLIITHGGVGSIMTALKYQKKIIGVPRLKKYGEHHNDHQTEILEQFDKNGYLIYAYEVSQLEDALFLAQSFQAKPYESNQGKVLHYIRDFINQ